MGITDVTLTDYAIDASVALSRVARTVAKSDPREAPKLIDFATRLYNISEELPQPRTTPLSSRRVAQFLTDLERLCLPPNTPWSPSSRQSLVASDWPNLYQLSRTTYGRQAVVTALKAHLRSETTRKALLKKLDTFLPKKGKPAAEKTVEPIESPEELPSRKYATFYNTLAQLAECRCSGGSVLSKTARRHKGRLELSRESLVNGSDVVLQTVFQASTSHQPDGCGQWSFVRVHLPRSPKASPHPRWADEDGGKIDTNLRADLTADVMQSSEFCALVARRWGAVCHQVRILQDKMYDLRETSTAKQMLRAQPSVPLSEALSKHNLSDDGKIMLAYAIAKSVWRFYSTDLMRQRWTEQRIHFMIEGGTWPHRSSQDRFSPAHPFVTMLFGEAEGNVECIDSEFLPDEGLVHWAPRIFTLGVMLVSIMSDEVLTDTGQSGDWRESLNNQAFFCAQMLSDPDWPALHLEHATVRSFIRDSVQSCLNGEIFNKRGLSVAERKALLYKKVVWPLEHVVQIAGINERRATWMPKHVSPKTASTARTENSAPQKNCSRSQSWLDRLSNSQLNHDVRRFYRENRSSTRTRVAVLDTGYAADCPFFSLRERQNRVKDWKDFVSHSSPRDEDDQGHGTHVLSVFMKVCPAADVYVARIAKNAEEFEDSDDRVAKAIDWAVNENNVDIIFMSFGWPKETGSGSISNAIETAVTKRQHRLLFYAAASNSGGDFAEWFPASHEFVTAVRATTPEGAFEQFNAPPDYSGADFIGTLGADVPGASSDPNIGERTDSGTSFATPIAAAISVLVLEAARTGDCSNNTLDTLRSRHGMRRMLRDESMSRKMVEKSWYLSALPFCSYGAQDRKTVLDNAALHA